jgi:hypothetical protein
MDGQQVSKTGDQMIGTLWKCRKGKIYILKDKYFTTGGALYYVFTTPSLGHVTLRDFFVERSMTKIA